MEREPREILIFEVGRHRYGLPAGDVQELLRAVALTPLPRAPSLVEGVINLRGKVIPVLDIRARFHLPARPVEPGDHLVVVRTGGRLAALRVDRALELARLEPSDLEDVEGVLPGVHYLARAAKLPDGLVLIHDLDTFLSHSEAAALEEILPAAGEGSP